MKSPFASFITNVEVTREKDLILRRESELRCDFARSGLGGGKEGVGADGERGEAGLLVLGEVFVRYSLFRFAGEAASWWADWPLSAFQSDPDSLLFDSLKSLRKTSLLGEIDP